MTQSRRSGFVDSTLSYVEVGASTAQDLQQFPPNGARPFLLEQKLGHGEPRFVAASTSLLTWRVFRDAGFTVEELDAGQNPNVSGEDHSFAADGTPFVQAGAQVALAGGKSGSRKFTVVRTADTAATAQLILGTTDAGEFTGEVCIEIENRENAEVWARATGFWHLPQTGLFSRKADVTFAGITDDLRSILEHLGAEILAGAATADAAGAPESAE